MVSLSIIVPVFNKESFIETCIFSILNQSYRDFELLLINDGSTDNSGRLCDSFEKQDDRVKVVHQKNQGVSAARNKGLELAEGTFIGFVDCDDTLEPEMYTILIHNMVAYAADISICGVQKFFPDKTEAYFGTGITKTYDRAEGVAALLKKDFLRSVYDKVYESALAKSVRFEGRINEDIYYNFLVFMKADKSVFDDRLLYNYIIRENSVSMSSFSNKWMDTIELSRKVVAACEEQLPELKPVAQEFDFVTNISLLNLLILSKGVSDPGDYKKVVDNIKSYAAFVKRGGVRRKHSYAYRLFNFSPVLYKQSMKLYCRFTDADVSNKV